MLSSRRWPVKIQVYLLVGDLFVLSMVMVTPWHHGWVAALLLSTATLVVLAGRGAYRSRLTLAAMDDLPSIALATLVGSTAEVAWLALHGQDPSGFLLVARIVALTAMLTLARAGVYAGIRQARRIGLVEHRTLILGAGEVGRQIARATIDHPEYGLRPVGMLDPGPVPDAENLPVPLLGSHRDLAGHIRRHQVSEVIVTFLSDDAPDTATETCHDAELVDAIRECDRFGCEIFCVPRFYELHHRSRDMDEVWGIPLVRARRATWRSAAWRVKRVIDVLFAASALLFLMPVMLGIAMAVRWEVGPRVLFRQVRVGLDGEPFTLLKFRSLQLPDGDGDDAAPWSINGNARLGPVGRLIRSTSLYELPQLFNILRGEMSLVGPRPERPEFVEEFLQAMPRYTARHRAPAGLTGWAQVNGLRGDTSIEERVRFDNYYIQNWSLWFDLKIMLRTLACVLLGRGS